MTPKNSDFYFKGLSSQIPETELAIYRSRVLKATQELQGNCGLEEVEITVTNIPPSQTKAQSNSSQGNTQSNQEIATEEKRVEQYVPIEPYFTFDQLVVDDFLREELESAVELINVEGIVFDQWGLRKIEPFPRTVLNFFGPPGTGKTLAAHALAHRLQRPIIIASYAQIESKFLGDAPKNIEALFKAAEQFGAVLFIDEADSLLSKRMSNVSQGSERAANSLTSQLLICLEKYTGVAIFATNFVESYDKAFETRVRHIEFPLPNELARQEIWRKHLVPELPLAEEVSIFELSQIEGVCGRDIKNAVIDAAVRTARKKQTAVKLDELVKAIERVKVSRPSTQKQQNLTPEEQASLKQKLLASQAVQTAQINGNSSNPQTDSN